MVRTAPLSPEMIVIGDDEKGIGLGGIMGGFETEVTGATKTVMLEAATFNGPTIRRTSKSPGPSQRSVPSALNAGSIPS